MKLFVDDIRDAPDDSWTVVRKVESAMALISRFPWSSISLDHDIENRPSDETYKPVAYFIAEKYKNLKGDFVPNVFIHSANKVGASQMASILEEKGIYPHIVDYKNLGAFNEW